MSQIPDMIDVQKLCEILGCGKTKAYQLLSQGAFRTVRIGKRILIPTADVVRFLETELSAK